MSDPTGLALGILWEENDSLLVGEDVRPDSQLLAGCRVEIEHDVAVVLLRSLIVGVDEIVELLGEQLRPKSADGKECVRGASVIYWLLFLATRRCLS